MPNAQAKAAAIKLGSDQVGDADARRTPQHNKTRKSGGVKA